MANALSASTRPVTDANPTVEELVRQLVSESKHINPRAAADDGNGNHGGSVIVDVDVDGMRYLLVRLPRTEQLPVQLSPREQEIVRMVAQGHPNKIIADVLSISSWTVSTYLRRIFAKLGVGSRAAMVARLIQNGGSGAWQSPAIPPRFGASAAAGTERAPRAAAPVQSAPSTLFARE